MFPMDSSSSSASPFSTRSTIASSPEATTSSGEASASGSGNNVPRGFPAISKPPTIQGMHAAFKILSNGSYPSYTNPDFPQTRMSPSQADDKPSLHYNTPRSYTTSRPTASRAIPTAAATAPSGNGSSQHGGTRSEPPKRMMEVDGLPVVSPPLEQIAVTTPLETLVYHPEMTRTKLLLQGDPQVIQKQRVETAIRVILDLLHQIPPSPTASAVHPSLSALLHDNAGSTFSLCRIGTFRTLRLQAGTTTKSRSKKQLQAGPPPKEQLAYLETAVHMSGVENDGRRVYACKRCRMREARRKEHKDVKRKKLSNSESDSSSNPNSYHPNAIPPSQTWVTGQNPDQYDPHLASQRVEAPVWDPSRADWRHEIVLFNSTPEVQIKDGSCMWLPFRVVCYGKCHGEKTGFRIRFTLRTYDGRVIATAETSPIKITDDHKTDGKVKPRVEGMTSSQPQPAVPRARKGRQSAASSRRQSPAPSEGESVPSMSEAGAVSQKQTPHVRAGKPYERSALQSPIHGSLPTEGFSGALPFDYSRYGRQHSASSIHTTASMSALPNQSEMANAMPRAGSAEFPVFDQPQGRGTVSPGALRHPRFNGFIAMDGTTSFPSSAAHSAASSNAASPISQFIPLGEDDLLMNGHQLSPTELMQALQFATLPTMAQLDQSQMISGFPSNHIDIDMANAVGDSFDHIFDTSSHASLASSYNDNVSAFSGGFPEGSLFSKSGLVPESDDMSNFLDFSSGQDQTLSRPSFSADSLVAESGQQQSIDQPSSFVESHFGSPNANSIPRQSPAERNPQVSDMLVSLSPTPYGPPPAQIMPPPSNAPTITTVIPAEGPVAGGTTVAIIGDHFSPDLVILFGGRTAKLERVSPTFIQCLSPPAPAACVVQVTIQGVWRLPESPPSYFKYNMMDTDLMRLALQVRDQYQGSSSDAAYRLAQHLAGQSNSASDFSEQSNSSPSNYNPSPPHDVHFAKTSSSVQAADAASSDDLQTTLITFLASLDENAPGSLRRSGAVNTRNEARQTLLHIATVMGFHRLVRRLVVIGAHLDLQDFNGYTALGLASLCGQLTCARVLIEAGSSYDRPTAFGEMPLDLAKAGDNRDVEALLLSAVWSTQPDAPMGSASIRSTETDSEIDNDNPSSGSDDELSRVLWNRNSRTARGKQKPARPSSLSTSPRRSRRCSLSGTPRPAPITPLAPRDAPPAYDAPVDSASWMSRTLSSIPHPPGLLPGAVWDRLPMVSIFGPDKASSHGWMAFPAPSWETLQKMASPEEVKLFTQAMAAAAFNAVVQSGATTTSSPLRPSRPLPDGGDRARKSKSAHRSHRFKSESPAEKVVKHVKRDRMLYLFWLPILLFVGFWLLVTALPLATGFCLIYARQITRAIKQRM